MEWETKVIGLLLSFLVALLVGLIVLVILVEGGYNGITVDQAQDRFEQLSLTGEVTIHEHSLLNHYVKFSLWVDGKPAYGECTKSIATGRIVCWYSLLEDLPVTSGK